MSDHQERFELVASMFVGEPITVRQAEGTGGYRGNVFLLPSTIDLFASSDENVHAYLFRIAYTVCSRELGYIADTERFANDTRKKTLAAVPQTLERLFERWPEAKTWLERVYVEPTSEQESAQTDEQTLPSVLMGSLLPPFDESARVPTPDAGELQHQAQEPSTQKETKSKDVVRRTELPEEPEHENPLVHSFEKVHTVDEYDGGQKRADGEDDLAEHQKALDELDLRDVVRSKKAAKSMYRADVLLDAPTLLDERDEDGAAFQYDEWDVEKSAYKKAYCNVFEESMGPVQSGAAWVMRVSNTRHNDIERLRAEIERNRDRRRPMNRQRDGGDVDIDAVVDAYASRRAGQSFEDRLYIRERRHRVDLASVVLLDLSLSSDSYVDGRRVLDVAKESIVVLGEALNSLEQNVAIAAFYGNTHRNCRFRYIKRFSDSWKVASQGLPALYPTGYTRIGPAIRHGAHLLRQTHARRQALVLLSDAKPTDYDGYEGRRGVMDVHQAIQECRAAAIDTHALIVGADRKAHFSAMFGQGGFETLLRAEQSADAMIRLFSQWTQK
ncbi:MAG: hypothetical protein R3A47_07695 [Polyangiales bacterium]